MELKSPRPKVLLGEISGSSPKLSSSTTPTSMNILTSQCSPCLHRDTHHNSIEKSRGILQSKSLEKAISVDIKKFTMQNWREYASLRFGDHERFIKSPHGKRILVSETLRGYGNDVKALMRYIDEVESYSREAEIMLNEEQEKYRAAEDMVDQSIFESFPRNL